MDSEALILVMTERMAFNAISPNTIKAYKQYAQDYQQAMSEYISLKKIPVSEIERIINRMIKKISFIIARWQERYETLRITLDEKVKLDYLYPKRNFSSLTSSS